jgi:DNA polymerase III subunit epsilon
MILVLDTETTGLIQRSLPHDHPAQPDLVQLGLLLLEEDGTERAAIELIVARTGIPDSVVKVHGIDDTISQKAGVSEKLAAAVFQHLAARAQTIVAHNLDFDERVIATLVHRAGVTQKALPETRRCTVEMATPILRIPATPKMVAAGFGDQYKKPNLEECHKYFFGAPHPKAHSALADARAAARVYFALRDGLPRWTPKKWYMKLLGR